jgi:hypothetical protein
MFKAAPHGGPRVDLLILGAGWTADYLISLCDQRKVTWAGTKRSEAPGLIEFVFDPESDSEEPFRALPYARTVLIVFGIHTTGAAKRLVTFYRQTHPLDPQPTLFIQLGTMQIWYVSHTSSLASHCIFTC